MSAEKVINEYLNDSGGTVTLESLQVYVQEGVSLKPLAGVVNFLRQVKGIEAIDRLFSKNKQSVRMASNKAINSVEDELFGDDEEIGSSDHKNNSPVNVPAPTNEREAENYLKRIYLYFKKFIKGLSFPELKQVFRVAVSVVTKLLIGVGVVGSVILTSGLIIPIALIITIICIMNAAEQTKDIEDETERINLKAALKNVLNGFKKMITSLKIDPQTTKFAVISSVIVGTLWFIKSQQKNIQELLTKGIGWIADTTKLGFDYSDSFLDSLMKIPVRFVKGSAGTIRAFLDQFRGADKVVVQQVVEKKNREYAAARQDGKTHEEARKIANDATRKLIEKIRKGKERASRSNLGKQAGKAAVWAIIIIGIATILYLFAEMVDNYNMKKVKEREEDKEEFERTL
jgi:hypothetical protein